MDFRGNHNVPEMVTEITQHRPQTKNTHENPNFAREHPTSPRVPIFGCQKRFLFRPAGHARSRFRGQQLTGGCAVRFPNDPRKVRFLSGAGFFVWRGGGVEGVCGPLRVPWCVPGGVGRGNLAKLDPAGTGRKLAEMTGNGTRIPS